MRITPLLVATGLFFATPLLAQDAGKKESGSGSAAATAPGRTFPKTNIDHAALKKLGWQLACQCWTFREMSLFETIDVAHGLGIHHLEMYPGQKLSPDTGAAKADHNMSDEQIALLQKKLKDSHVDVVSYGVVNVGKTEDDARKVFEFAKKMKLKNVVSEPAEDQMETLDKLANEYKINLAIHNHPKPSHYWDSETVLKAIEGRSNRVGACADIGHWRRSGFEPVDQIRKLKGHIIELHFKDIDDKKEDVPWTTGTVGVADVVKELQAQGFKGVFSIEYERGKGQELIDNVAKSVNAFSELVTKAAADAQAAAQH
jgi:sugar phosphate isomerase/epimerase